MKTLKSTLAVMASLPLVSFASQFNYPHVDGELIVKVRPGSQKSFLADKTLKNVEINRELKSIKGGLFLLKTDQNKSLKSLVDQLQGHPAIEYVEPNFIYTTQVQKNYLKEITGNHFVAGPKATNDPRFGELWGLNNTGSNEPNGSGSGVASADVRALQAWQNYSNGDKQALIAVIDTGVDYNHEDLKSNMWINQAEANGTPGVDDDNNGYVDDIHGYDFANNDGDPMDGHGHGTHCAGTIAATHDNGKGVAGVMAEASIVAIKFLTDSGSGTTADAIEAIDYATTVGVDLMSNSWGGGGESQALKEAIERARDAGIIFTAAAGNSATNNDTRPHYPSNYQVENVISVAAHNAKDQLASFSCYGRNTVHIAAPGRNILSTVKQNGYAVYSGTSMATPHVSGVIGLVLANEGRPSDLAGFRDKLMLTSTPVRAYRGKTKTSGRINAYNLLSDTRPVRNEPNPNNWQAQALSSVIESDHPYANNTSEEWTVSVPGAKYVRVVVKKFELENKWDYLEIVNANGDSIEKISGADEDYRSDYVEGDTVTIRFKSDYSVSKWGFVIDTLEYQTSSNIAAN